MLPQWPLMSSLYLKYLTRVRYVYLMFRLNDSAEDGHDDGTLGAE